MSAKASEPSPEYPGGTGVSYTLREAADITGKARGTIRRYLDEGGRPGRFPNASQDAEGVWRIPLADLIAAGLSVTARYGGEAEKPETGGVSDVERLRAEAEELRQRVAVAEANAEVVRAEVERLWMLVAAQTTQITNLTAAALPAKASGWRLFRKSPEN